MSYPATVVQRLKDAAQETGNIAYMIDQAFAVETPGKALQTLPKLDELGRELQQVAQLLQEAVAVIDR